MIEYKKPHLSDLEEMQALVQEEVEKGLILPRSLEEMAKNIRSYVIATTQAQEKINGEENEGIESGGEKNSAEKAGGEKIIGFCALHIYTPLSLIHI